MQEVVKIVTNVLIVDDSKLARIVAGKTINKLQPDWIHIEASNADEAMAIIERGDIHVVLVDYNMPDRNGLELAQQLRALDSTIPIALITANAQDEVIAQARSLNVTFVGKPVTPDGLKGFISGAVLRLRTEHT